MIAAQVAGKAARDALFLTNFDVRWLPLMVFVSAGLSLVIALAVSKQMQAHGPRRVVPVLFGIGGTLMAAIWLTAGTWPRAAAILLYLEIASFGALLISAFWSLANERFEPRTGKRFFSRIAWAAALGGLVGGFAAERFSHLANPQTVLLLIAALQIGCALLVTVISRTVPKAKSSGEEDERQGAFRLLKERPYLRQLALLVGLLAILSAVIDYAFKAEVSSQFQGRDLLRFFAIFYTAAGALAFVLQLLVGGKVLEKLGVGRAVSALPIGLGVVAAAGVIAPGWAMLTAIRGSEETLRSSIFRAGYELLYVPVKASEKRRVKAIVDVAIDRLGTALGALLVGLLVLIGFADSRPLLAIAVLIAACIVGVAVLLQRGYSGALGESLMEQGEELDLLETVNDGLTRSVIMSTLGLREGLGLSRILSREGLSLPEQSVASSDKKQLARAQPAPAAPARSDLYSNDTVQVLKAIPESDLGEVGRLIELVAWDEVAKGALKALIEMLPESVPHIVDAMLDIDQPFTIRRRLPRVLRYAQTDAVSGLLDGLSDRRFEVRFECARALLSMRKRLGEIGVEAEQVLPIIAKETSVAKPVWETRTLLDSRLDEQETGDESLFLRGRSGSSLKHVFNLLALIFPAEPLQVAYRGLHTTEERIRGTALEYLEQILPNEVREPFWPLLESGPLVAPRLSGASRQDVQRRLLASRADIDASIARLRKSGT